jgi:hypothetical protein
MLYRWFKIGEDSRRTVWQLYGWYTGLMLFGSCAGAVTWAAWMQVLQNNYVFQLDTPISLSERLPLRAIDRRWRGAYGVMYAIEFLCLSVAKLMILERMSGFAQVGGWSRRWIVGGRIVIAVVVAGNLAGLAGNVAAAVEFEKSSNLFLAASGEFAASNTAAGQQTVEQANTSNENALRLVSVQSFCEVVVLLVIVLAFAVVGVVCARRISSAMILLPEMEGSGAAMAAGKQLRRQIVGTAGFVFCTFLVHSAYSILNAVVLKFQDQSNSCPENTQGFCNASCYNVFAQISEWMFWTPEFQLTVVIISKPLSLLVALWGMTNGRMFVIDQVVMQHKTSREATPNRENTRLKAAC